MARTFLQRLVGAKPPHEIVHERRRNLRHATVFQVARIMTGGRQELCILRNVSPDGLKAEVYMPASLDAPVTIELKTGHCLNGRIAWARDQFIGVAFDTPVPMMQMLAHCSMDERVEGIRPPRLDVDLWGSLRIDQDDFPIRVSNISQAGMKFDIHRQLAVDTRCEIRLDNLDWRGASVRWYRDGEAGILLDQPMLYPDFAAWRRALLELHPQPDRKSLSK